MQGAHQGGTYSRPGAEPAVLGTASNWHTTADANYSPDRIEKLSNEAGLNSNHNLETTSNPDSLHGNSRTAAITQRDSGSSTGQAQTRDGHISEYGSNGGHPGNGHLPGGAQSYQIQSGTQGQSQGAQPEGFTHGHGQQGFASGSSHGNLDGSDDFVNRLPSTGIPPVFHPPSYIVTDTPSYTQTGNSSSYGNSAETGGHSTYGSDTHGVNAKQALEPLTEVQADGGSREADNVHAKQALDPLTRIADSGYEEEAGGVHAKDALQPLTQVPAQGNNQGFVESIREYLPGQHQTGSVEVSTSVARPCCNPVWTSRTT